MQTRKQYWTEWAWWGALLAIIVAVLLLASCANLTDEEFARHNATPTPNYQPMLIFTSEVPSICTSLTGKQSIACSDPFGRITPERCTAILPLDAPDWLIEEESVFHCKHGRYHR